jgi:hypothetical protein
MSKLDEFLKMLEMSGRGAAFGLDKLSGKVMGKSPRLSGAIDSVAGLAHSNPRAAGGAVLGVGALGGAAAGIGANRAAGAIDEQTASDEMPDEVRRALIAAGEDPRKYHSSGRMAARGAVGGAGLGVLAHALAKGGYPMGRGKWAALGALGGGLLGSGVEAYQKDE